MEIFNINLYLLWAFSAIPMFAVAFYGLFKCGMDAIDFIIVCFAAMIPIVNTIALLLLIVFTSTGALKRNGSNQY